MEIIYWVVALVLSLTLHEFAHAWVGFWLGDETAQREGRLTLNPMAHIDPFMTLLLPLFLIMVGSPVVFGAAKPVPFKPWALRYGKWGAAMVAAAGPLTNLFMALVVSLWLRLTQVPSEFLVTLVILNIGFFVFNMIPFPPLDGSRLLYAVMPYQGRQVMDRIEQAGLVAIAFFMFIGYGYIAPYISLAVQYLLNLMLPGLQL
jgi:Zn-dependent protease